MSERVVIVIETGTSAFNDQPATELARILFDVATRIQDGEVDGVPVMDANGVSVGSVKLQRMRK